DRQAHRQQVTPVASAQTTFQQLVREGRMTDPKKPHIDHSWTRWDPPAERQGELFAKARTIYLAAYGNGHMMQEQVTRSLAYAIDIGETAVAEEAARQYSLVHRHYDTTQSLKGAGRNALDGQTHGKTFSIAARAGTSKDPVPHMATVERKAFLSV